jgi:hypothetical protein
MSLHQSLPHLLATVAFPMVAHSKVKSYDVGEELSNGEKKCSISDEHVSSVGGGSRSITSRPDLFKSITKLSFDGVSRQPVLG